MRYIAAFDIGGTHARLCVEVPGRNSVTVDQEGFTLTQDGAETVRKRCAALLEEGLAGLRLSPDACAALCCGAAGVDEEAAREEYAAIFESLGIRREVIRVYNDCEVLLVGYGKPAILIAAGTGSIVLGRGAEGKILRCGGWGWLVSDAGSGCALVLDSLRYAVRAWDGLCEAPALLSLLKREAGMDTPIQAQRFAQNAMKDKRMLAALAPLVCRASHTDTVVAELFYSHAETLARHAAHLVRTMHLNAPPALLWGSLLLETEELREPLCHALKTQLGSEALPVETTALEAAESIAIQLAGEEFIK